MLRVFQEIGRFCKGLFLIPRDLLKWFFSSIPELGVVVLLFVGAPLLPWAYCVMKERNINSQSTDTFSKWITVLVFAGSVSAILWTAAGLLYWRYLYT